MSEIPVPEALQPYMPLIVGIVTALLIFTIGWLVAKWSFAWLTKVASRGSGCETMVGRA